MQFIDLAAQQQKIRQDIVDRFIAILDHGRYVMGSEITELEQRLADFTGAKHAIGCASGTDALLMALMAYGVGPGDAIFTSPFTFIATGEVIQLLGATPVFVDIDPTTFNMDPGLLEKAVSAVKNDDASIYPLPARPGGPLTPKGIIPVDLFGLPADYDALNVIAAADGMFVVEDAAQSFGGAYKGRRACSLADVGCTSFFPAKPLGCYGDGGMCFTDSAALDEIMRSVRIHGQGTHKYDNVRIGINGRLDTIQAAILLSKMTLFETEIALRQQVAGRYGELLDKVAGLAMPVVPEDCLSVWAQYSILAEDGAHRERLQAALNERGIPTAVYYPIPLHLQTAFSHLGYRKGAFAVSEDAAGRIFSLPMHPYLEAAQQQEIAGVLAEA